MGGEEITKEQFKQAVKEGRVGKKKAGTKIRDDFFTNIEFWCNNKGIKHEREFPPFPKRRFSIDLVLFVHGKRVAIEWEGLVSNKSGHTTIGGYSSNCVKYNRLSIEGWIVIRYTVINHKQVYADLEKILSSNVNIHQPINRNT